MSGGGRKEPVPLVFDDEELIHGLVVLILKMHDRLAKHLKMFNPAASNEDGEVVGRLEFVVSAAYCTHFGVSPVERFVDAFEQAASFCEHLAKDHIFYDGNKRTALVMLIAMVGLCGYDIMLSDASNPEDNTAYQWIQKLVSGGMTSAELAALVRENAIFRIE